MSVRRAAVVVVGDELLDGSVTDVNGARLARVLTSHGVDVTMTMTLGDDESAIADAIETATRDRRQLVFVCGGIGVTHDDVTYAGIARFLGGRLEINDFIARAARRLLRASGDGLSSRDIRAAVEKLAALPRGASVMSSPRDWEWVARVDLDGGADRESGASVFVLPGRPEHMEVLLQNVIVPQVLRQEPAPRDCRYVMHTLDEVSIARDLAKIQARHPNVRIASYPGDHNTVRLQGETRAVEHARSAVQRLIERVGGPMVPVSNDAVHCSSTIRPGARSRSVVTNG